PGLRATDRPQDAHRCGAVQFLRLRRHQWHAGAEALHGLKTTRGAMSAPTLHVEPLRLEPEALLRLAAAHPERYPVLLDSAAEGALSRCSLLAALPRGVLWMDANGKVHTSGDLPASSTQGFLAALDAQWRAAAAGAA